MNKALQWILAYIFGLMTRSIAPLMVDKLQFLIVRAVAVHGWTCGRFLRNKHLSGNWQHVWYASGSSNWPDVNHCTVTLIGLGRHAAGVYVYLNKQWLVTASLDARGIVTGTWCELGGVGSRGAWLGKRSENGNSLTGWYLGTSDRAPTSVGEWIWWRDGSERPPLPQALVQSAPRSN